jgi:hypothetical protein
MAAKADSYQASNRAGDSWKRDLVADFFDPRGPFGFVRRRVSGGHSERLKKHADMRTALQHLDFFDLPK